MENKLKKIAIQGHETRGSEVIELIENLGGVNHYKFKGENSAVYFYKGILKRIETTKYYNDDRFVSFTLEEFLEKYPSEKYPYKVGDKVVSSHNKELIGTIVDTNWKNDILYTVQWCDDINNIASYYCYDLQPYKESIYIDHAVDDDSKTEVDIFISNKSLGLKNGYIANNVVIRDCGILLKCVKNKLQYPKTYEECCQITEKVAKTTHELDMAYNPCLIYDFQKLLICRDAYWKIAGDWKPIWKTNSQIKYLITRWNDNIIKETYFTKDCILAFPTEEMRDAFYENFYDLIEKCKEFL